MRARPLRRLPPAMFRPSGEAAPGAAAAGDPGDGMTCPTLPSSESAYDAVRGVPGAWPRVASHWLGRALIIAAGGLAYTFVSPRWRGAVIPLSLAGSTAIEAAVLWHTWRRVRRNRRA